MKWNWWRGLITLTKGGIFPPVLVNERYPFWALYPRWEFIKPIWWGVN